MSILRIHDKLLDHLIKLRKNNPDLFFMPRKINNQNRLNLGYWFLGNNDYVYVDFWNGTDWKEKVNCIGFVVLPDGTNYLELSAQGCPEAVPFLEKITDLEPGFVKAKSKNKWFKFFEDKNYEKNFDYVIQRFKPNIDRLIRQENPPIITMVTKEQFNRYGLRVIWLRNQQIDFGKTHKITRLSWNTNNWQYPSGWLGKSRNQNTHEGKYGFGYEEWLFDRSKIIDGFHYAFVKGLESEISRHAGKHYEINLYSQNSLRSYYYVGKIRDAEGIDHETSREVYRYYQENGWLNEMAEALERVEADVAAFRKGDPKFFFNVRFRLDSIDLTEELVEIDESDDNITTDRFKLLAYRGNIVPSLNAELPEDTEHSGNWKNTNRRKRTFNSEQVYDPYHDQMQNAIVQLLRNDASYGYRKVDIEISRVDIKGLTTDNIWHYFEIKTDSPKRSIRQAIGQVMEYAYYPDQERADKLFVVGDREPEDDSVIYLAYLREHFNIPVWYRYFNWDTKTLSVPY